MDSELIQALHHFLTFPRKAILLKQDNQNQDKDLLKVEA